MDSPGRLTRSGAKLAGRSLPPSETARAYGGWSDRTRGPLAQHLDTMGAFMRSSRSGGAHTRSFTAPEASLRYRDVWEAVKIALPDN